MNLHLQVIDFIDKLDKENFGVWDRGCKIIFLFKDNIIKNILTDTKICKKNTYCFLTPILKDHFPITEYAYPTDYNSIKTVVSIGASKEHNNAKEFIFESCKNKKMSFIAIPFPLSNDSFCTNKSKKEFDKIEVPSRETVYPTHVIIDLKMLSKVPFIKNIMGIGEVLGLVFSINDFIYSRSINCSMKSINSIEEFVAGLLNQATQGGDILIKKIALGLIMKCLVMCSNKVGYIGALGDHMLAYALDRKLSLLNIHLTHGQLVYLGSIIMANLFPYWIKNKLLKADELIYIGLKIKILNKDILRKIIRFLNIELIETAIKMRPNRPSSLIKLNKKEVLSRFNELSNLIRQVIGEKK